MAKCLRSVFKTNINDTREQLPRAESISVTLIHSRLNEQTDNTSQELPVLFCKSFLAESMAEESQQQKVHRFIDQIPENCMYQSKSFFTKLPPNRSNFHVCLSI